MSRVNLDIGKVTEALELAATGGIYSGSILLAGRINRNMASGRGPSAPGTPPNRQTSKLARSIVPIESTRLASGVRARTPYAMIQEKGGTIRGKGGKFLTVPLSDKARRLRARYPNLKDADLALVKTPRAAFLTKNVGGKNARTEFLFILKKQIKLPPRPYLWPGVRNNANAIVARFADVTGKKFSELVKGMMLGVAR